MSGRSEKLELSLRQAITPKRMQGRMNATMRFLVWGTIPIGSLLGGALGTVIGLRETILLGGVLGHYIVEALYRTGVLSGLPIDHAKRTARA